MKVLIVCETSGEVRRAFRDRGHDAWSCDLLPADDGSPYHYMCDMWDVISNEYDLIGMHPECTYLCRSGIHWNNRGRGWERTEKALDTVRRLMAVSAPWYLENPVGMISSRIRKPDQIIHPYQFGHDASKQTCLWLHNLPRLVPTDAVPPRIVDGRPRWGNQSDSGQNTVPDRRDRWKIRSATYRGIARAMAQQWG